MKNSPTMCQMYVAAALTPVRKAFPKVMLLHYMDDILGCAPEEQMLEACLQKTMETLRNYKLHIAPEKIQRHAPFQYLGYEVYPKVLTVQKLSLRTEKLNTLNDFQKLIGDIQWMCPVLGLTTYQLQPLYDILRGDSALNSPHQLTKEAQEALREVELALSNVVERVTQKPLEISVFATQEAPTAVLHQGDSVIEWVNLPAQPEQSLTPYPVLVARILLKAIKRAVQLSGIRPDKIYTFYTNAQINVCCETIPEWQILLAMAPNFTHGSPLKITRLLHNWRWILEEKVSKVPLKGPTIFTDASKHNICAVYSRDLTIKRVVRTPFQSTQQNELYAIILALTYYPGDINIISDSAYSVGVVQRIATAQIKFVASNIYQLFKELQEQVRKHPGKIYILHVHSHSGLPGPIFDGNSKADSLLTMLANTPLFQEAQESHFKYHQAARALRLQFGITREEARSIVKACTACLPFHAPTLPPGKNPCGLRPNEIWQMDVTHYKSFGCLSFIHVVVDTFSGFTFAIPAAKETA
uniref:Uncharacterized protein n=1 Tax=Sarcophilus harrisii TaxID=9305 RepID=A0A7N4V336_SARHA